MDVGGNMTEWQEDVEKGWKLLSFDGAVQWFATKEEPGGRKRTMGGGIYSLNEMRDTVRNAQQLGWNLYANANPVFAGSRRKVKTARDDIAKWRYIVMDLDPTENALVPPYPAPWANRIYSGRGYQFWIPIGDVEFNENVTRELAERGMKGWLRKMRVWQAACAPGWNIDYSCSDLARVVRFPGSINQKTGNRATVERIIGPTNGVQVGDVLRLAIPLQEKPVVEAPEKGWSLYSLLPYLNATAKKFILGGGVEAGDRHRSCYATAKSLHELGVSPSTATSMLGFGARECNPPLQGSDVLEIIRKVFK
jgi:hypothetical protein